MSQRNSLKLVTRNQLSAEHVSLHSPEEPAPVKNSKSVLLFFIFTLITTVLVLQDSLFSKVPLTKEDIGRESLQDIVAIRDFSFIPDDELVKFMQKQAAHEIRPVFSVRKNAWLDLWTTDISYAFRAIEDNIFAGRDELALARFNSLAGINLDRVSFWSIQRVGFKRVKKYLQILFASVLKNKIIVQNVSKLKSDYPNGIEVIILPRKQDVLENPHRIIIRPGNYKMLIDPPMIENLMSSEIETRFTLENNANMDMDSRRAILKLAMLLIKSHIQPSGNRVSIGIIPKPELTAKKRKTAEASVKIESKDFVKGDIILKKGKKVTLETVKIIEEMMPSYGLQFLWFLGHYILISTFFALIGWFSTLKFGGKRGFFRDFYIAGVLFLIFLGVIKGGWYLSHKVVNSLDPMFIPALFPVSAGALLVRVLMGTRLAVFFAIAISFISAWSTGAPVQHSLFYFITGLVAAGSAGRIEHRYVIWRVGLIVIGINLLLVAIYRIIDGSLISINTLYIMSAAIAGGVMMSVIMSAVFPLVEYLGDYVTDIKLLELTNTEQPLLKSLRDNALGTYQHSQNVADLAYSAAQAVGARALLVKVAAYYHDIGKSKQPKYFIENQSGENPHDKLKPSMSALIIKNHVKDSREMLEKAGIPKDVIEVAVAHHGTTLIEYFYIKAKEQAGQEENIREEDFRYPGPIPQSREAGILMLADTVEAAVRSKSKINQSKSKESRPKFDLNTIKETVQYIINKKFSDNQLDASELTLKDLSIIAETFVNTLSSVYHERISYPEQTDKNKTQEMKSQETAKNQDKSSKNQDKSSKNQDTSSKNQDKTVKQEKSASKNKEENNHGNRRSSSSLVAIKTQERRNAEKTSKKTPPKT